MKLTVSKMAEYTGVSVRTLHYYDEKDLLKPSFVSDTGYRYYDESSVERLQEILFFRELDFSLEEIKALLESDGYSRKKALKRQKKILELKQKRLKNIIKLAEKTIKGEKTMSFSEFSAEDINEAKEKFAAEVREKWGGTQEYKESLEKSSGRSEEESNIIEKKAREIFDAFAALRGEDPDGTEAQSLVKIWQGHISEYHYKCSKEILSSLADMYTGDERFTKNIDKSGKGTAEFMSKAIKAYCK